VCWGGGGVVVDGWVCGCVTGDEKAEQRLWAEGSWFTRMGTYAEEREGGRERDCVCV
jgi:hypothetical protein